MYAVQMTTAYNCWNHLW